MIPSLLLGFWDRNTVVCAGAIPYRKDFPATTRFKAFQAQKGMILPAMLFLAWTPRRCAEALPLLRQGLAAAGGLYSRAALTGAVLR